MAAQVVLVLGVRTARYSSAGTRAPELFDEPVSPTMPSTLVVDVVRMSIQA